MKPECSSLHSQLPANCPYPVTARFSPCHHIPLPEDPSNLGLPSALFPSVFHTKTLYTPLLFLTCAKCPAHFILLDFITQTILGEEYRPLSSSLRSSLHSPATPSLLGPNILLSTLFSNSLSLRSSLNVSDHVSHPYKTTG